MTRDYTSNTQDARLGPELKTMSQSLPTKYPALHIKQYAADPAHAVELRDVPLVAPGPGEVLVRNRFAGVNAIYDYGLISGVIERPDAQLPCIFGFESLGEVVAVGSGVELAVGSAVTSLKFGRGYRQYFVAPEAELVVVPALDPRYLVLHPTGISAWLAMHKTGAMGSGEAVFVSAAAGGFGHIATQLAVGAGNRVVVSCGSAEKTKMLLDLGVDAVINYRSEPLAESLQKHFPDGIDLALDTVGGESFDALVANLANHGRLVSAGFTSDAPVPEKIPAARVYAELYWKSASIRGFMNPLHKSAHPEAHAALVELMEQRQLAVWVSEPTFDGLDQVVDAIQFLRAGRNVGKVIVRIP